MSKREFSRPEPSVTTESNTADLDLVEFNELSADLKKELKNLKRNSEIVRVVNQQTLLGILILKNKDIVFSNDVISEISGYKPEELLKFTYQDIISHIHPDSRQFVGEQIKKKLTGAAGAVAQYEIRVYDKDNNEKNIRIYSNAIEYKDEKALLVIIEDLTEKSLIQSALNESENKYKSVVENATEGICIIQDDRLKFVNPRAADIIGRPIDKIMGMKFRKFVDREERKNLNSHIRRFFDQQNSPPKLKTVITNGNGRRADVELNIRAIPYQNRRAALVFIHDISEREKIERAIRESERKYRQLAEIAQEMIIVHDFKGIITYANKAAIDFYDRDQDVLISKSINEILDIHHPDRVKAVKSARQGGDDSLFLYEAEFTNKTGDSIPVEVSSTVIVEGDQSKGVLLCARNIKERQQVLSALRESEFKYRMLFEASSDAIFIETLDGIIIDCNGSAVELYEYSKKEMMKLTVSDLVPAEVLENMSEYLDLVINKGSASVEAKGIKKNGQIFPTEVVIKILTVGEEKRVIVFVKDITDRKNAENALRQSERKYHNFFDNAQVGMFRTSIDDGTAVEANERIATMFGFDDKESMIGKFKTVDYYVNSADRDRMIKLIKAEGVVTNFDAQFYRKDKSIFWLRFSAWIIPEDGVIEGVATDITAQKETVSALMEAEARYRHLVENSNDAFYLLEEDKFTIINKRFSEMLGVTSEEVVAPDFNFMDLVHPSSKPLIEERMRMIDRGESPPNQYEFTALTKDGRTIEFEASITYIEHKGKKITQGILRDISEKIKLEEQVRQTQKIDAIGRLAGGIAHDFNNLLTAIIGHVELMEMRMKDGDPLQKDVSVIRKATERAASLTKQLLAFSRKQTLQPKVVNLNEIIIEMDQMLCRLISEDIELKTIPYPDLPNVKADQGQVEQVIMNLVINARDAMDSGGKLTIETGITYLDEEYCTKKNEVVPGEYSFLAVSDTGVGMSKDISDKVFEPFFTTKEVGKGTGLGLATVHGIVKQSGGHVSIYSEIGQGTTMKVYLPVIDEESERSGRKIIGEENLQGTETVLLVEDEDYVREMSIKALSNKGYTVIEAANGGEALLIAEEYHDKIDILVTDVVMPRMSGEQLAQRLKKRNNEIRVLFMSGYTPNIVDKPERKTKLSPFLQKPFGPYELVRRVRITLDGEQ